MDFYEFIIAMTGMVMGIVTLWILVLNKKGRHGDRIRVEPDANYNLKELSSMAESLTDRIDILEAILDAEVPDWREQNEQPTK